MNMRAARDSKVKTSHLQDIGTFLGDHFGLRISPHQLKQYQRPGISSFLIDDFIEFCEDSGLNAHSIKFTLSHIKGYELPLLAFDSDNNPILVLELADVGKQVRAFAPHIARGISLLDTTKLHNDLKPIGLILKKSAQRQIINFNGNDKPRISFFSLILGQKWLFVQVLLAAIFSNLLALAVPIYTMVIYDRVLPTAANESLIVITLGVAIAILFDFILKNLRAKFIGFISSDVDNKLGDQILQSISHIPVNRLNIQSAKLMQLFNAFDTMKDFLTSATVISFVDFPFIFLYLFVIYLIGGSLVYVPMAVVILSIVLAILTHFRISRRKLEVVRARALKTQVISEVASGIETIKAFDLFSSVRKRYFSMLGIFSKARLKSKRNAQFGAQSLSSLQQTAQIAIIFYGVFLVQKNELTMGGLIATVILLGKALAPVIHVSQTLMRLSEASSARSTIEEFLSELPEDPVVTLSSPSLSGDFRLEHVTCSLSASKRPIFQDLCLNISAGEKICILGPNGSGKSTLLKILAGLVEVDEGQAFLDNLDIKRINRSDMAANIGVVFQNSWNFSGTIRDNLISSKPAATNNEINFALEVSGAQKLIDRLDNGLDFVVGEKGHGLSQGELQLMNVTRALLHRPNIFLFDEPTSFLDGDTEKRLVVNLMSTFPKNTFVFVTHRPALLETTDRILQLQNGKIYQDVSTKEFMS